MTETYRLNGMTCSGCESTVKSNLLKIPEIVQVEASKDDQSATITMNKPIPIVDLQNALGGKESKYQISVIEQSVESEISKSWFETYKPILLIFAYIIGICTLIQLVQGHFEPMEWMRHFMAAFFLVFSFFKMLNLIAFSESYQMYDIIAKRIKSWGYVYVFIELGLGIFYLLNYNPLLTNLITLIIMSISIVGVIQSVLDKRRIQCACLGAVFNLPMSTVTIIEDALMIVMSAIMIYNLM
ncbi:MAG: MauE/DoxX family redox-associated membrane protein [Saprospiraceae bacterium]